jgi:hypothetical protein
MARRKVKNHWFVSVEAPKQLRLVASPNKAARQTKTFPTEADAKQFAREMVSENTTSSRARYWALISRYVVLSQPRNSIAGLGLRMIRP